MKDPGRTADRPDRASHPGGGRIQASQHPVAVQLRQRFTRILGRTVEAPGQLIDGQILPGFDRAHHRNLALVVACRQQARPFRADRVGGPRHIVVVGPLLEQRPISIEEGTRRAPRWPRAAGPPGAVIAAHACARPGSKVVSTMCCLPRSSTGICGIQRWRGRAPPPSGIRHGMRDSTQTISSASSMGTAGRSRRVVRPARSPRSSLPAAFGASARSKGAGAGRPAIPAAKRGGGTSLSPWRTSGAGSVLVPVGEFPGAWASAGMLPAPAAPTLSNSSWRSGSSPLSPSGRD